MHEFFASLTPRGFFLSGAVSLFLSVGGFGGFGIWDFGDCGKVFFLPSPLSCPFLRFVASP